MNQTPQSNNPSLFDLFVEITRGYVTSGNLPSEYIRKLTNYRSLNDSRLINDYRAYLEQDTYAASIISNIITHVALRLGELSWHEEYGRMVKNVAGSHSDHHAALWSSETLNPLAAISQTQRDILAANPAVIVLYIIAIHAVPETKKP